MADLEAVLADVSYLMAMEKSKSTPAARASKKIILPDPRYVATVLSVVLIAGVGKVGIPGEVAGRATGKPSSQGQQPNDGVLLKVSPHWHLSASGAGWQRVPRAAPGYSCGTKGAVKAMKAILTRRGNLGKNIWNNKNEKEHRLL